MKKNPYILKKYKGSGTVDATKAPPWWLSRAHEAEDYLRSLKGVEVTEFGKSAGGRSIICATYGRPHEEIGGRTCNSLSSAVFGKNPNAFYGTENEGRRKHDCFMFVGNVHGVEFEGTVAMLNALNVVATGKDLRGQRWPRLQEAGRKLRIIIVPHFNIDGRVRFAEYKHQINVSQDDLRRFCQGNWKNGEPLVWPSSKLTSPIPVDQVDPLGGYFNDNGVNLAHDLGLSAPPQPETKALTEFLRKERPDCVLLSHTDNGSLVQPPDSFVPQRFRSRQLQLSAIVGLACKRKGYRRWSINQTGAGYAGEGFYQTDLIYHTCGALPVSFEFPYGSGDDTLTFDEVLDIGLTSLEEILCFGAECGFRPWEY